MSVGSSQNGFDWNAYLPTWSGRGPAIFLLLVLLPAGAAWSQVEAARATDFTSPQNSEAQLLADALPQAPAPQQSSTGTVGGTVMDPAGAIVVGAVVTLMPAQGETLSTVSAAGGAFHFVNVPAGQFEMTVSWPGFATQTSTVVVRAGEHTETPAIRLVMTAASSNVDVTLTTREIADFQIKEQEKQRILGFLPNFYISYAPHPVPLSTKQKFELALKTNFDPVTFVVTGIIAGIEQSQNGFAGYGQGAAGYGKRYGANYTDGFTSTIIGGAILPSLLKQDPRYFYKGTGTIKARTLYAIANAVVCKGDNGKWQFDYSAIGGALASGGISNLYYPPGNRGAGLVFENAAIGIGSTAIANLFQEFLIKKLTPHLPKYGTPTTVPDTPATTAPAP
jgi:hypothetical protein